MVFPSKSNYNLYQVESISINLMKFDIYGLSHTLGVFHSCFMRLVLKDLFHYFNYRIYQRFSLSSGRKM